MHRWEHCRTGWPTFSTRLREPTSGLKDVQLVLSLGDHVDPKEIGPLPASGDHRKISPQLELLKRGVGLHHPCGIEYGPGSFAQGVPKSPSRSPMINPVSPRELRQENGACCTAKGPNGARSFRVSWTEVLTDPTSRQCALLAESYCRDKRALDGSRYPRTSFRAQPRPSNKPA